MRCLEHPHAERVDYEMAVPETAAQRRLEARPWSRALQCG